MQPNPWKLATIGLALVGTTALGTGLTTSYMMRTPAPADAQEIAVSTAPAAAPRAPAAPRALVVPPAVTRAVAPAPPPPVTRVSTAAAPADCDTGGDRALRIAKPGLLGGLLGAGLGAAGGAIADGGKAAGKGALIGGLAGAALGGGYGAYKTKQECGTVFGDAFTGLTGNGLTGARPVGITQASR